MRGDLQPVAAGEELGGGLDDVLLLLSAAEEADAEAGDDAGAGADIGADDDVAALGGAAAGAAFMALPWRRGCRRRGVCRGVPTVSSPMRR